MVRVEASNAGSSMSRNDSLNDSCTGAAKQRQRDQRNGTIQFRAIDAGTKRTGTKQVLVATGQHAKLEAEGHKRTFHGGRDVRSELVRGRRQLLLRHQPARQPSESISSSKGAPTRQAAEACSYNCGNSTQDHNEPVSTTKARVAQQAAKRMRSSTGRAFRGRCVRRWAQWPWQPASAGTSPRSCSSREA